MTSSNQTLSVVLTVHNAEKTLAAHVGRMLDVLPDLTSRFELLIVDDGSTDQTEEVAHELARDYPQLRVARHPRRLGSDASAKTALENTTGEIVILHDPVADAAVEPRVVGAIRRDPPLETPANSGNSLRLIQDPALARTHGEPRHGTPSPKFPLRGVRIAPRRTETAAQQSARLANAPHGEEQPSPALPESPCTPDGSSTAGRFAARPHSVNRRARFGDPLDRV